MTTTADRGALSRLTVLGPVDIDAMPWQPVPGAPGVFQKVLWRFDDIVEALLRYTPGSATTGVPHLAAHHHIWVVEGAATIAGHRLTAGSYMHVPPRVAHAVTEVGPEGCTLLHMHRPHGPVGEG